GEVSQMADRSGAGHLVPQEDHQVVRSEDGNDPCDDDDRAKGNEKERGRTCELAGRPRRTAVAIGRGESEVEFHIDPRWLASASKFQFRVVIASSTWEDDHARIVRG